MLKLIKQVCSLLSATMIVAMSISVSAASNRVNDSRVIGDYSIKYKSSNIVFSGTAKNLYAGTADRVGAYGTYYLSGREFDSSSKDVANKSSATITYKTSASKGTYQFDFHGEANVNGTVYWDTRVTTYTNDRSGEAISKNLDQFLLEHADSMISKMALDTSGYYVTSIDDNSLPYTFVKYYFGLNKGTGYTRPVIYADSENQNYIIAYQQNDGTNVVEKVSISANQKDSNGIHSERHTQKSERYDFEEEIFIKENNNSEIQKSQLDQNALQKQLVTLANDAINKTEFNLSDYECISVEDDDIPYEVSKYCAASTRGKGSTMPIIYHHNENNQFLVVYQQNNNIWKIIEFLLKPGDEWTSIEHTY